MFDLEQSIAAWRQQMRTAGIQDIVLDELESHLAEEVARQVREGIEAAQAFESAVRQIGAAETLRVEFAKSRIGMNSSLFIAVAVTGWLTFLVAGHLGNPMVIAGIIAYFFVFFALVRYIAHRLKRDSNQDTT
jgi:uncharacterized YccA/Bax inhibitor family protein